MNLIEKLASWDRTTGGVLAIFYFFAPYAAMVILPPQIVQYFWTRDLAIVGVGFAGAIALIGSLASSAIWNAYIKPTSHLGFGVLGLGIMVVGLVMLDELNDAE